jgi:hypothetical protein
MPHPKIWLLKLQLPHIIMFINLCGCILMERHKQIKLTVFLVDRRHKCTYVLSFRTAECDTSQNLVVATVRERLVASQQRMYRFHVVRFSLKKLNEVEGREQYCVEISNRFAALENKIFSLFKRGGVFRTSHVGMCEGVKQSPVVSGLGVQSSVTMRLEGLYSQEEEDEDDDDDDEEDEDDEEGIIVEFCQEHMLEEVLEHAVSEMMHILLTLEFGI